MIKNKKPRIARLKKAESEGFEPRYLSAQWFSRPPHSTTLPTLRESAKIEKTFIIDNIYKNK